MPVRGTPSYVWFTEQPLGSGATGNVFGGRHKVGYSPLLLAEILFLRHIEVILFIEYLGSSCLRVFPKAVHGIFIICVN